MASSKGFTSGEKETTLMAIWKSSMIVILGDFVACESWILSQSEKDISSWLLHPDKPLDLCLWCREIKRLFDYCWFMYVPHFDSSFHSKPGKIALKYALKKLKCSLERWSIHDQPPMNPSWIPYYGYPQCFWGKLEVWGLRFWILSYHIRWK